MGAWFDVHPGLMYELYGASFLVLGAVALVLPRDALTLRLAPHLWLLGAFGASHGTLRLFEWAAWQRAPFEPWVVWVHNVLWVLSYGALLEFGRRTTALRSKPIRLPAPFVHGAALCGTAAAALLAPDATLGWALGVRYCVGVPGALLTGIGLLPDRGERERRPGFGAITRAQYLAGLAFLLYAPFVPLMTLQPGVLPAWLPSAATFHAFSGIPVQIVRASCAIVASVALVWLVSRAGSVKSADLVRVVNTLDGFVYRCRNDRDWTLIYMTGGVRELCGYDPEDFLTSRTQTWGGLIHEDDAERVWNEVQAAVRERRDFTLSYRVIARDGGVRWVYERGRGVFDLDGSLRFLDGHITNATARMNAIADLRVKDAAIESSLNAIALAGSDGKLKYVNRAFVALWGFPRAEDALGHSLFELWTDAEAARVVQQALQREGRFVGLLRARSRDGKDLDLQVSAHSVDGTGEPAGVMAAFEDVTARLQLAEELRHERDFAANLVATAPIIIVLLDREGRIQHVNPFFEQLSGVPLDEVKDKDWFTTFLPARDHEPIRALFTAALAGKETRGNVNPIVTSKGEELEIEWNDRVMRDARGQPIGLLAAGQNITERKRSVEALRQSRQQLRDILDAMFAFVALFSIDGEVIEANRAPFIAAGLAREDVIGRRVWDTYFLHEVPHGRETIQAILRRAAAGETVRGDVQMRVGPEQLVTMDAAFAPVRDQQGAVVQVVASGVDVTEQRQLERHRQQLEAQLRQAQKLEALGTLAGGIAHDFNNVLMAILGNIDIARNARGDQNTLSESVREIDKAARRAQDLVQRILAFSRRQEQTLRRISLLPVVEEAVKLLRSTLPARVELQLHAGEEADGLVMADASQVHQVVMNLVTNAWHAMSAGRGRIQVAVQCEEISGNRPPLAPDLRPGRYVRIDVSDDGCGMDASTLERIFEPFFTTKPSGQGTGLGLSVVHGILKAHGGAVTVESQTNAGTTFHVFFPVVTSASVTDDALGRERAKGAVRGRILYVDDEQALVAVYSRLLKRAGYEVSGYTSGEDALAAFRKELRGFDLVLTDQSMPGMSGMELAHEIRALNPGTPIILISGFLREEEANRTKEHGIAEVVMKPCTGDQLATVVAAVLQRSRSSARTVA